MASRFHELDEREWQLVYGTYAHAMQSLERNEEMGERRLQLLFTVASAAAVAVGLVADGSASSSATLWTAAGAAAIVGLLGLLTVGRLARRNTASTKLIRSLDAIRREATDRNEDLRALFVYDPGVEVPPRTQAWAPTKGGLVDVAGCATATFCGAAALLALLALDAGLYTVVTLAAATALASWLLQVAFVRRLYRRSESRGAADPALTEP